LSPEILQLVKVPKEQMAWNRGRREGEGIEDAYIPEVELADNSLSVVG
jgi:hypothetical protein